MDITNNTARFPFCLVTYTDALRLTQAQRNAQVEADLAYLREHSTMATENIRTLLGEVRAVNYASEDRGWGRTA